MPSFCFPIRQGYLSVMSWVFPILKKLNLPDRDYIDNRELVFSYLPAPCPLFCFSSQVLLFPVSAQHLLPSIWTSPPISNQGLWTECPHHFLAPVPWAMLPTHRLQPNWLFENSWKRHCWRYHLQNLLLPCFTSCLVQPIASSSTW